jgi:hypothetical protein
METNPAPPVYSKRFRPALIAGVGLVFLQQVTGQPSVLYYAASIFKDAGLASVATVGVAAFKLIMTMVAVFTGLSLPLSFPLSPDSLRHFTFSL